jgi:SWI/SNF chromatin-remodeling complex subunit SWI1
MQQGGVPGQAPTITQQMLNPQAVANLRPNLTPQQMAMLNKQRKINFLQNLSKFFAAQHNPLPPSITGVEPPPDPNAVYPSPWRDLEPASEPGVIKFAGKELDLFKLWHVVNQAGGHNKVQQQGMWANFIVVLGLPENLPQPQEFGNTSTATALAQLYMKLLNPFEVYYKGVTDAQRNALAQQGRLPLPQSASFLGGGHNVFPSASSGSQNQAQSHPQQSPQALSQVQTAPAVVEQTPTTSGGATELDAEVRKRKTETGGELNMKRRRTSAFHSTILAVREKTLTLNLSYRLRIP